MVGSEEIWELWVDSRLYFGECMNGELRRVSGNCVFTADFVRVFG